MLDRRTTQSLKSEKDYSAWWFEEAPCAKTSSLKF